MQYYKITVYDVAEKVLPMFDKKLGEYAMKTFRRENIDIKTSHHVQELRKGAPSSVQDRGDFHENEDCYTIRVKEEGEVGIGMCVWSTGLMMNPFVQKALGQPVNLPVDNVEITKGADKKDRPWLVKKHPRNGGIITNDRLRVVLEPGKDVGEGRAVLKDVYAVGDCAVMEDTMYPATAQVANQKARWLAKRLNKRDIDQNGFTYKNLGVMAYIGNWNAIMQSSGGDVSGRIAWFVSDSLDLTGSCVLTREDMARSVPCQSGVLAQQDPHPDILVSSTVFFPSSAMLMNVSRFINWIFGRDISRF